MRAALAVLAVLLCRSASAQTAIETRNHRALSLLFLRFLPAQEALESGRSEWTVAYANANDFRVLPARGVASLEEDYEISRLSVRFRQAFEPGGEWFAEAPLVNRGPGFMDAVIDWWHAHVLGWPPQRRDQYPEGRARLFREGRYELGGAFGLGDVSAGYRREIGRTHTLRAAIELPTGNPGLLQGSGSVDIGLSLDVRWTLSSRWTLAGQAALIVQGGGGGIDGVRGLVDQEAIAFIWRPNSRDEWIGQWQSERAPVRAGVANSDAPHRLITLGYRRRLSETRSLQLFFSENGDLFSGGVPELASIGPDFTFGLTLALRN